VSSSVEHERRTIQCDNIIFFLESENQLKTILQIVSQTCCQMAIGFGKSVELFSIYSHSLVILLQTIETKEKRVFSTCVNCQTVTSFLVAFSKIKKNHNKIQIVSSQCAFEFSEPKTSNEIKSICTYFLHPVYIPNIARSTLARRGEDLSSFFFRFGRELHQMNLSSNPRPSPPLPASVAIRKHWILFKSQFLFKLERRTLLPSTVARRRGT
jgi:hypothetical protein